MKNSIYIFLFLFLFSLKTNAQSRFNAGIKAGISTSQVEGDTYGGFNKAGFDAGAFLNAKINEKWSAQFEVIYIQKGSKHNSDIDKGDLSFYWLKLNYLEVPLLFQYHQKKFTFELGLGYGYLINYHEYNETGELQNPINPFKKEEISASVGISYLIFKNLGINWRYTNSLFSIRDFQSGASYWFNPGYRNNVLAFTLTYQFGNNDKTE